MHYHLMRRHPLGPLTVSVRRQAPSMLCLMEVVHCAVLVELGGAWEVALTAFQKDDGLKA